MTAVEVDLLDPQLRFLQSENREVLYSGAFGAGKTRTVAWKAFIRASVPGAREGLCRKNLVSLKRTTLKTCLEPDGLLPPVMPPDLVDHRLGPQEIKIKGGGEIVYFGLDDPAKIASLNLSGCGIDEAVELTEADWTMLRGRVRLSLPGLPMQIYGACNPGPPSHFLAERFGLALDHRCADNCEAIHTRTIDNHFLPQSYIDDLMTLTGVAFKRYVLGLWVGSDGLVYDRWDRTVFAVERQEQWVDIFHGVDEGYTNPAVILTIGVDSDGRLHVLDEWYQRNQLESDVVAAAKSRADQWGSADFIVDPSAAGLRAAFRAAGLGARPANNEVFDGIQAVQSRLVVAGDGRPRLTVDPSCTNLVREFESYEWKAEKRDGDLKDDPIKKHDHALDALRYAVVSYDGLGGFRIRGPYAEGRETARDSSHISAAAEDRMFQ